MEDPGTGINRSTQGDGSFAEHYPPVQPLNREPRRCGGAWALPGNLWLNQLTSKIQHFVANTPTLGHLFLEYHNTFA